MLVVLFLSLSEGFASEDVYYIYMSPHGSDLNYGDYGEPVLTLDRVQEILKFERPDCDVVVRIASDQGDYINQTVLWTYYNPEHTITFEAYPIDKYAVFRADPFNPPFFPFFRLDAFNAEPTNLVFRKIMVEGYVTRAFLFFGDREEVDSGWNGYNVIEDCIFKNIGNFHYPDRWIVYGVITFVNSRYNRIVNCRFIDCSNYNRELLSAEKSKYPDVVDELRTAAENESFASGEIPSLPILAIYIAHNSHHNRVEDCRFENISGDVVRFRDNSNWNIIANNLTIKSGFNAVFSSWYCVSWCTKDKPECELWENIISGNVCIGSSIFCKPPLIYKNIQEVKNPQCTSYPLGCSHHVRLAGNKALSCSDGESYELLWKDE